ncbi:McrB family protein [Mongoliitalea daihaiensis]|uniref:McrB family protein n=1 Tax=Mongoliitalea daihaiensis TaxID=2782006 RepID=UPI001F44993B|nr:AAA family ATPase [Mongoliitalea daihaiensis]UJP66702.1 AAA family ATPase [Mongoliitalea daihaiensis]
MIQNVITLIKEWAAEFGATNEKEFSKSYILRENIKPDALKDNGAFFGFIHPDEETSGAYHDYSFVIFPTEEEKPWVVSFCIGSSNFKRDYEMASRPGLRRLFSNLTNNDGYCSTDFTNTTSSLPSNFSKKSKIQHLSRTIGKYSSVINSCQIIENPLSEEGKKYIKGFLAAYAKVRGWPTNPKHRGAVLKALKPFQNEKLEDDRDLIFELLKERRFVILQGPPGTGKTTLAKEIATKSSAKSFFTQFHAETTYSDFIYGIRPNILSGGLSYEGTLGNLAEAVLYARDYPNEKVVLIIDEINRANLSNVLGPVFYLFEHKMKEADVSIKIAPGLEIKQLPSNFYVVATMNTADRSLAVVDFALRRRFAWYTVKPKPIQGANFYKGDFNKIAEIFDWYATSNELNLQPGQGYFLANSDEEMENRIRYEIFPLIREYIQEGLLTSAIEEFNNYFTDRINQPLFE